MAEYKNVEDELNAILNGNYETLEDDSEGDSDAGIDEDLDSTEEEDTDREDESDDGTETNDDTDGDDQDTEEVEDEEDEENTLVDDDGLEDEDDGESDEDDESDEDEESEGDEAASEDENGTDTDDSTDGQESETTDAVDYRKQYEELAEKSKTYQDFYEQVAGVKFKANGKEFEGFKDPKKIIQAQQMAYNYSEKMAGFKQYRPYMGPLKDRGMIDDPTKFDLAMSLIDGDKEALKQHISNLGIDPIDLDMENIAYTPQSKTASRDAIAIEDALEAARSQGVGDRVYNTVMKEWDDESFREFVDNPAIQNDLIEQMANGDYDTVMSKVGQMSVLDTKFASMKKTDQYKAAIRELVAEDSAQRAAAESTKTLETEQAAKAKAEEDRLAAIVAEKEAAARAEIEAKYKAKAEAELARKNAEAKEARKKASIASKKKPNASKRQKEDPMDLKGAEITNFLDKMIMGKK